MGYPNVRLRRMRRTEGLRSLVRETSLASVPLVMPYFVREGRRVKEEISSMPGQFRFSIDELITELEAACEISLEHILLFGIPGQKDEQATQAYHHDAVIQRAVREIKRKFPRLTVMTDVCLCEYMSHGHCGVVKNDQVLNDESLVLLSETALSHAEAGADIVAPSDMMDGRVGAIRKKLDDRGFSRVPILSYAAKYASAFYGPFRVAADSAPQFGDRNSYQMDPANGREALREIELDLEEGADLVMVKPALSYLDVIYRAKEKFNVPIFAYHVSGEYAMVKAAAMKGFLEERRTVLEILTSIARAGANAIVTYHAKDVLRWNKERSAS